MGKAEPADTPANGLTAKIVADAEAARCAAMISADVQTLERLLAEDLVYFHSGTLADDKPTLIRRIRHREIQYRRIAGVESMIRIQESVAVITGRYRFNWHSYGSDKEFLLQFHAIWVSRPDGLKFWSWQANRIPPDSAL